MKKLILFTNTYPYGGGETFLDEELPYLANKFDQIVIYPLYKPSNEISGRCINKFQNVLIEDALIPFDHKDKLMLIKKGIGGLSHLWQIKEYIINKVFLSGNKNWLFFNYAFIHNAILENKETFGGLIKNLSDASIAYFYWGDKSALIIPKLKKKLTTINPNLKYVVRFHGSDIYEEVKGYLPFRNYLFPNIDYAITISNNGKQYLQTNYKIKPKQICTYRLGSIGLNNFELKPTTNLFHIISCSNAISLKRLDLIAKALNLIEKDIRFIERMKENGYEKIKWTHIGDGPQLEKVKSIITKDNNVIVADFKGKMEHNKVLNFYNSKNCSLFIQVSTSEGIPVSIMEALSFGIPVMATNVGGVGEIINTDQEDYGVLLDKNLDDRLLAGNIKNMILMEEQALIKMKISARKEWESNWNGDRNYSAFAEFMANLV